MKRKFLFCIALAMIYAGASAQSLRQIDMEEEMLRTEQSEIANAVAYHGQEQLHELQLTYHVPQSDVRRLADFIKNREMRKYCYNSIYADFITERVRCKLEIDSLYRDSINTVLIPLPDSKISGDNISYALKCRRTLKLDSAQYDYMMDRALDMARRMRKSRTLNVWNEEMNILKSTLSKQQLRTFFFNKNARAVTKKVDDGWKRLADAGLTEQMDSITETSRAFFYFHEQQKIKDLYRYYGTSQKKYLAELSKNMPLMVKMLDGLDKKARIIENEKKKGTLGKEFIW